MERELKPQRKKNRLTKYDYSQAGYYFVTLCTRNRTNYFGEIQGATMKLGEIGLIAKKCFVAIPKHFDCVAIDQYIIMPNHIHGIIVIHHTVENNHSCSLRRNNRNMALLPKVISQYKSSVTRLARQQYTNTSFAWQKSYYDHIIRNNDDLNRIREYIDNNPLKWTLDKENPIFWLKG